MHRILSLFVSLFLATYSFAHFHILLPEKTALQKERKLIETLAADLAQSTFAAFPIPWIDLELKKFILPETRHISFQARFLRPKSKSQRR